MTRGLFGTPARGELLIREHVHDGGPAEYRGGEPRVLPVGMDVQIDQVREQGRRHRSQ